MGNQKFSKDWRENALGKPDGTRKKRVEVKEPDLTHSVIRSEDLPEQIKVRKCATLLDVSAKTIERLRKAKKLKFMKRSGRWYTTPEWIAEYLERESEAS